MKKSNCSGCYNNFYNQGSVDGNTKECWMFKNAKMIWCKLIPNDVYPQEYWKYKKQRLPSCYRILGKHVFTSENKYYHAKKGDYKL